MRRHSVFFEANKNCYVMGPLVAGNIDGDFKVWHAESCQRIIGLSKQLAEVLVARSTPPVHPVVAANVAFHPAETVGALVRT